MARRTRKRRNARGTIFGAKRTAESDVDGAVTAVMESKCPEEIDDPCEAEKPATVVGDEPSADRLGDRSLIEAVQGNTELLQQLLSQVSDLREDVLSGDTASGRATQLDDTSTFGTEDSAFAEECDQLRQRIAEFEDEVSELRQQNSDLASQVASSNVRQTVSDGSSGCHDALSWEERKQLILQQMEEDVFDADDFVSSLQGESEQASEDPTEFVQRLSAELESRDAELERRDEELRQLRHLLDQQSGTREGGIAVGAAAIAEMVDADELVQQERQRLQLLQEEWEEKFRQGEIEASLERAKLSRERQELAHKQSELEEQLEQIQRESRKTEESGAVSSRRWLVKLGLSEDKSNGEL